MFGFCVKKRKVVVAYLKSKPCIISCESFTSSLPGMGSTSLGSSQTLAAGGGWVFLEKLGKTHSNQLRAGFLWSEYFFFLFLREGYHLQQFWFGFFPDRCLYKHPATELRAVWGCTLVSQKCIFKVSVLSNLDIWAWFLGKIMRSTPTLNMDIVSFSVKSWRAKSWWELSGPLVFHVRGL